MDYRSDTTQTWKLSKIRELADTDCLINLPHQRLEKSSNKRKGPIELISAIINKELSTPWIYSDLNSNYEFAKFRGDQDEEKYFESNINRKIKNDLLGIEINKIRIYSIEDSQQRTADLRLINDSHFQSEKEKEMFWNSEVPVQIHYNCSVMKLVKIFTRINDGTKLTIDDKLWGYPSPINEKLKELVLKKDWIDRLYVKKRKDESNRDLYKNLKKIMLVCGYHDNVNPNIKTTTPLDVRLFTESESSNINLYKHILDCFVKSIDYLQNKKVVLGLSKDGGINKEKIKKDKLTHQAKTTFIIHILNKLNVTITENEIDELLLIFTDTRNKPEFWYKEIFEYLKTKHS